MRVVDISELHTFVRKEETRGELDLSSYVRAMRLTHRDGFGLSPVEISA